jgi:2-polyprenyl-3-methyl-5-hydroxy-6-metoxy-1,4-benzoquinol methylase
MSKDESTEEEAAARPELAFTGERFTPECVREIRYEHLHRYAFARDLVGGKSVLDAACGEGYGSALMAATAATVNGVDLSPESVAHASARYRAPNLDFRVADCLDLPFDDATFDCVVSFETLEHLDDHDGLLREFRRVLKPDGFLLVSSPDKAVYSDQLQNRNEFHVRELYRSELETLLAAHFPAYRLWGQRLTFQSAIWRLDAPREGGPRATFLQEDGPEVRASDLPPQDPVYFLAMCAAAEANLPESDRALSLFDDADQTVYAHYYYEIRKNMAAGEVLAARERELAQLRAAANPRSWWRRLLGRD